MALRTVKQYREALRDGRVVYLAGERVPDVTTHPVLKWGVEQCGRLYVLAHDPRYHHLVSYRTKEGVEGSFLYFPIRKPEDLLRVRDIVLTFSRINLGHAGGARFTGRDVLNALTVISARMDRELKTNYSERINLFRQHLLKNDLDVVAAMTDVKGDRHLRPADQKPHQDYYVRIVDEQKDGIVVRGAKFHISSTPFANEIFVCPTRAMRAEDKDYAVSFAIPVNTPGVSIICSGAGDEAMADINERPLEAAYYNVHPLVVFDDVFVPIDRVFLNKEWQFSWQVAHMFGNFHRIYADTYKIAELELVVGVASLMAEYNGIERVEHVRDQLAWLGFYTETVAGLGFLACNSCIIEPKSGLVYPNPIYSNAAKFFFADNWHQAVKYVQDITGGIICDIPSFRNFLSPETRPLMEKYFGGKVGIPTEHRLRAVFLAADVCSSSTQGLTLHAEGSLSAQKIAMYGALDWDRYKALARRAAGISDGSEHPLTRDLPPPPPAGACNFGI